VGHPRLDLSGRVAVVIGGTSGIGRALSLGLADAGADVVPCARTRDAVDATAEEVEARGRQTLRVTADVTDRRSLEEARDGVIAHLGKVDILVNSAGRIKRTPALDLPDEEWSSILDINLTGTLRACQVFAPSMLAQGYGRIVNVASLTSYVAFFEVAAYTASKAGVAGLTRALAIEWGPKGVNVNAIAPGVFRTPLNSKLLDGTERGRELKLRTPLGRFGQVEECVGATVFLSSEGASFVNGEIIAVDGGFLASGVNQ
jgi:NAD(P)-dependent dehydrogenase (short-subunit alcohol dehydrogenase family)